MANIVLGNKLKHLRQLSNLTQQEAANLMGLKSKSTISMWESGKTEPDVISFLALCCHYGVDEAKSLIRVLGLEETAAFDFSLIAAENNVTEENTNSKKPYAFCPYCGEKLD